MLRSRMPLVVTMSNYGFLERFPVNIQIGWNPPSILVDVILDRHSRLKTSDLQARLKALDLPGDTFTPEQVVKFVDLMQVYEGAMYEISTKLEILDDEFQVRFSHDPIHHMERRLKSVSSIIGKLERKNLPISVNSIKDNLFDVAGIRVICNYRDDVYSVSNYLSSQSDIQVLRVKDYIKNPKQNGYRSLHVIYAVPVFLSSGAHYTPVEVQFRTIAMDYWASLEHALRYKTDLPDNKLAEHSQTLLDCARSLQNIEVQMQNIHRDINGAPQVAKRLRPRTEVLWNRPAADSFTVAATSAAWPALGPVGCRGR